MTPKQKLFTKEYLLDLNATRAAISAGYSAKTAHVQGPRLLGNVSVQTEINKLSEKRAQKLEISAEYVLGTVKETVERCRQAEPIYDSQGHPVLVATPSGKLAAAYRFAPLSVLKGCELLGKHLRLFDDKTVIPIAVQIVTNVNFADPRA